MTITKRIKEAFVDPLDQGGRLIRLAPNAPPPKRPSRRMGQPWTHEEHDRFLEAMELFPSGPWKLIAAHVGTRNTRQTMTHAQKYRQKIARWKQLNGQMQPELDHTNTHDSMPSPETATMNEHSAGLGEDEIWAMLGQLLGDDTPMSEEDDDDLADLLSNYEPLHLPCDDMTPFDGVDSLVGADLVGESMPWMVGS